VGCLVETRFNSFGLAMELAVCDFNRGDLFSIARDSFVSRSVN
jgi:hypothetical protein